MTAVAPYSAHAAVGTNKNISFQGRLFNTQGATVPDGTYNIQFKIYQDGDGQSTGDSTGSPAGTLKWTESYLNNNSQGVTVKNGYMSAELGSITPFGTSIDWNQDTLWLSINIGTTAASCTPFTSCTPDGEMVPMKRLSSATYSLNSAALGGLTSAQFVQFANGVQTDAGTNTSSIFINKTGTGNLLELQSSGVDSFDITSTGDAAFGNNANHNVSVITSAAGTVGRNLALTAGAGGSGSGSAGGNLTLQGGSAGGTNASGGNVAVDAGIGTGTGTGGTITVGAANASSIQIGSVTNASGTQTLTIGANSTGGSTTNVTVGAGAGATAGTTLLQSKNNLTVATNGIARATFDNAGDIYFGNGVTATAPSNFTISGTGSTATAVAGGSLVIQGGNATVGNANGGNVTLSGGAGVGTGAAGVVVLNTPAFSTVTNDPNCYTSGALVSSSCTIAASTVNGSSAVIVGFNAAGQSATLPNPTNSVAGRIVYVTSANGSNDFTLVVNGGGVGNQIAMRQNTTATMIWNGSAWTAAGASSSTTLQSAYDNTLQSAGGAELTVSHTGTTNGLNIRDSSVNPVNGTLLTVQSASAATLFSVNSNVTEYASDAGAEVAGSTATTFPASTWVGFGSGTVSRYTTAGSYINTGQGSVSTTTTATANDGVRNILTTTLTAGATYNVSFATRIASGTFTDMNVFYSVDGSSTSSTCATSKIDTISVWTKINCSFVAPTSGITTANSLVIQQASGVARTFYVDNLSVTLAANFNYATDGGVDNSANFSTNWTAVASSTVTRSTTVGNDASDSAQVVTTGAGQGVRNLLAINPLPSTLYRVTAYVASTTTGFSTFTAQYSRNNGTNFTNCTDYNTQTVSSSTTSFTKVTCYLTTDSTAATAPYLYFTQSDATGRTFYVDTVSMNLSTATTPNVQIGGGVNGGPVTLLTLDRGASAPIASNNDSLLGSMYYDTTLGKLQCYEANGWGPCGSSPDTVVTISPEYTNAVMHGTGVGTMTSDLCSGALDINDGTNGQATVCGNNDTYNYYRWTSPQASAQTYSVYVTYQLPSTFKTFDSGQTSIKGRTDSANSTIVYQVYRSDVSLGLLTCGTSVAVSTGAVTSWQTGTAAGAADPSTCGFVAGNSIVFKITLTASANSNAYLSNLNFMFANR